MILPDYLNDILNKIPPIVLLAIFRKIKENSKNPKFLILTLMEKYGIFLENAI